MTKKEQKYIESLKDENDGLRSLLIRFIDEVGKLTNIDNVVNMSLIPLMTEKTKKFKSEFKSEAYKECIDMVKKKGVKVGVDEICIFEGTLDNLLKEMVGENNV